MADPSERSRLGTTIATIVVAVGVPPGVVSLAGSWPRVLEDPGVSLLLWLPVSGALYALGYFARRVATSLMDDWADDTAGWLRRSLAAPGQRRRYLRQLAHAASEFDLTGVESHGILSPLMEDVYVDVRLDEGWAAKKGDRLEARWTPGKRVRFDEFLTAPGTSHGEYRLFLITGQPGAGKTALLRHTTLRRCDRHDSASGQLPVLVYLRDHAETLLGGDPEAGDLVNVVAETSAMHGVAPGWLRGQLERGNCLVMLDGLDEIGDIEERSTVADWINAQRRRYPNVFVVTSRPRGFAETNVESEGVPLHILAFTVKQIKDYLRNWYDAVEHRVALTRAQRGGAPARPDMVADDFRQRVRRKATELYEQFQRDPVLFDLASRPLLLAMIANVHRFRDKLPRARAELYREICDMLLKRSSMVDGHTRLTFEQRSEIIRKLALYMMERRSRTVTPDVARTVVAQAMSRYPHPVSPRAFLDDDMVYCGMLIVSRNRYEFPHATIQEFLASTALLGGHPDGFLATVINDPWWRETIKLYCARTDATAVVRAYLDDGSDEAKWMAFECAKHPHQLDQAIRAELDRMRESGDVPALVKINDNLHESLQLREDLIACARPVNEVLYQEYALWAAVQRGEQPAPEYLPRPPFPSRSVQGIWATDVQRFVTWVNDNIGDEQPYRLPALAELADDAVSKVVDLSRFAVWAAGSPHPVLYRHGGVRHAFAMGRADTRRQARRDRTDTSARLVIALGILRGLTDIDHFADRFGHTASFDQGMEFARRLDSGDDADPILGDILARALAAFNQWPHRPEFPSVHDLSQLLKLVPNTNLMRQLVTGGVFPASPSDSDFVTIRAHLVLLQPWLSANHGHHLDNAIDDLDAYLGDAVAKDVTSTAGYPEDVLDALESAEFRFRKYHDAEDQLSADAAEMLQRTRRLVEPILARAVPYDPHVARAARASTMAAAVVAGRLIGMDDAAIALSRAYRALSIVNSRREREVAPNELLLLVRA
ncbi:MAG TPA: NACHT domain-containing protein [Stackebrandtia sp.]|uniref:NACHT domain-containing protein n=1 Tax=Stackebrandtia sp. TaxID=2023065 RepID=UPI002D54F0F6|nr:NACHT domain-containing protein [Stackebrandtia sp.]HZE41103.1 NACHT domain-containing protein [Stackebrandtia sp.]